MPADPSSARYPAGSAQAFANDNFNHAYTSLPRVLDRLVNSETDPALFGRAIGLMMSLKSQGRAMMSGIPNPALEIGPGVEYQPVNPSAGSPLKRVLRMDVRPCSRGRSGSTGLPRKVPRAGP